MVRTFAPPTGPSIAPSPQGAPTRLLPLRRPPSATAPAHPPRPPLSDAAPPAGWERSLHAAPAAWPKQSRVSHGSFSRGSAPFGPAPANDEPVELRRKRFAAEAQACIRGNVAAEAEQWAPAEIEDAVAQGGPAQWLSIERWRRSEPVPGGVTLVFAHANGLNKEVCRSLRVA